MDVLKTESLSKIYDGQKVVNSINLNVQSGKVTGLLGRNGAGKTTTFLMLAGIVKPDSGNIVFNNKNLSGIPSYERAEMGLIYLPQQHSVFIKATVYMNLFQILELKYEFDKADRIALELIDDFGLLEVKDSQAYQLSGGEKRRLEIARAMIMKPKFLFLDEPFTGIDPITIMDIQKIVLKLKERGIGVIVTDHNVKDIFDITDTAYIIHKGKILDFGKPSELILKEETKRLFLGEDFEWEEVRK